MANQHGGARSGAGRPTAYTPELSARIVRRIERGSYLHVAAEAEGISRGTFYAWCGKGERGEEPFAEFVAVVARANAAWEEKLAGMIDGAASDDWRAAAWRLERRFPDRYGQRLAVVEDRVREAYGKEIGERLLARLSGALARFGVGEERAGELLDALIGDDGTAA